MMDSYEFMVFSIDQQIQCIQQFEDSLMFVSTSKRIILYDLCNSSAIASCEHSMSKIQKRQEDNQDKGNQNSENQLRAIQIHYFQSFQNLSNLKGNFKEEENRTIIGHLLLHYKMKGISIYTLNKVSNKQNFGLLQNERQTSLFQLNFNNFTEMMFGSAFLKLAFNDSFFTEVNKSQRIQLNKTIFKAIEGQVTDNKQIEKRLKDIRSFGDFQLDRINNNEFYVFTNENELYEVKMMKLKQGILQILETYQLDEQTAQLSLSTVTEIKVISYVYNGDNQSNKRTQRQLILAMQGGNLYIYQLPSINPNQQNKNIEHYLQPIAKIYLQQYIKPKMSQKQDLDYSVLCIQMISDGLGLVVVNKCGIWLVDFKNYKIITKIQQKTNKEQIKKSNQKNKHKNYLPNDIKILKLINSNIIQNNQSTNSPNQKQSTIQKTQQNYLFKKYLTISSTLAIYTFNKLIKLNLILSITKQFNTNNIYQQSVEINSIKHTVIEQINTTMIQSLNIQRNYQKYPQTKINHTLNSQNNKIQFYGNFKQDKIFTFTL